MHEWGRDAGRRLLALVLPPPIPRDQLLARRAVWRVCGAFRAPALLRKPASLNVVSGAYAIQVSRRMEGAVVDLRADLDLLPVLASPPRYMLCVEDVVGGGPLRAPPARVTMCDALNIKAALLPLFEQSRWQVGLRLLQEWYVEHKAGCGLVDLPTEKFTKLLHKIFDGMVCRVDDELVVCVPPGLRDHSHWRWSDAG